MPYRCLRVLLCILVITPMVVTTPAVNAQSSQSADARSDSKRKDQAGSGDKGAADTGSSAVGADWKPWNTTPCEPTGGGWAPRFRNPSETYRYILKKLASTSQPYYLAPALDNATHLYAGQELVIQIEASSDDIKDVPLVSISVQSTAATALNPAPVRPTSGAGQAAIASVPTVPTSAEYACAYALLVGDTVPSITATAPIGSTAVQLLQANLPQVHTLYYFNVATGVIASKVKDNNINRVISKASIPASGSNAAVPAMYATTQTEGDPRVIPALFFTAYIRPLDAEVPFEWKDFIPEPSVGFSLTGPADDFFFGGSSEFFIRNVQLVYGLHYGHVNELVPGQTDDPASSTAQATQKVFKKGAFVGLTFNIDFIKGLFGGGK